MKALTKKLLVLPLAILLIVSVFAFNFNNKDNALAQVDYTVSGGRVEVDFNSEQDASLFNLYTEFDTMPYVLDGKLYFWGLAEQKAIYNAKAFNEVEVSVDISPINKNGKIDSGILIGASGVGNAHNQATAWCINIEKSINSSTFVLKIHRFLNSVWDGVKIEVANIPYVTDSVNLKVVCKAGVIYAFVNGNTMPTLTYDTANTATGFVGFRNYYSPNTFDNFTIVGEGNAVDLTYLQTLIAKAEDLLQKNLVDKTALESAKLNANNATTQSQVDIAVLELENAISSAIEKRTLQDLSDLLEIANNIENTDNLVYTTNSWNSFIAVKNICATLNESSSDADISYWYLRLDIRINNLIKYSVGEVA